MSRFSSVPTFASSNPGPQAAAAIIEGLQKEIPPERIVSRIKDMLEATCIAPSGAESPDWRAVEAGVMLYLAWVRPVAAETHAAMAAPPRTQVVNGLMPLPAFPELQGTDLTSAGRDEPAAPPQPVAMPVPRTHPEPLEIMRKMMVADPHILSSGGGTGGRATPRRRREGSVSAPSCTAAREQAVPRLSNPVAFNTVTARRSRWCAVLLAGIVAAGVAGLSDRTATATLQAGPQRRAPRAAVPAAAVIAPQSDSVRGWFLEDLQAEFTSGVAHRDLLE